VAGQLALTADLDPVRLGLQLVGGWNAPAGGHVQVDLWPHAALSPSARVEFLSGVPGGALGVAWRPKRWFVTKAEMGIADGMPQAWLEVAVYRPWPPAGAAKKPGKKGRGRTAG
jgi:hypothetical protein